MSRFDELHERSLIEQAEVETRHSQAGAELAAINQKRRVDFWRMDGTNPANVFPGREALIGEFVSHMVRREMPGASTLYFNEPPVPAYGKLQKFIQKVSPPTPHTTGYLLGYLSQRLPTQGEYIPDHVSFMYVCQDGMIRQNSPIDMWKNRFLVGNVIGGQYPVTGVRKNQFTYDPDESSWIQTTDNKRYTGFTFLPMELEPLLEGLVTGTTMSDEVMYKPFY